MSQRHRFWAQGMLISAGILPPRLTCRTHFHLPRSTMLMLVAALTWLERIKAVYAYAIASIPLLLLWRRLPDLAAPRVRPLRSPQGIDRGSRQPCRERTMNSYDRFCV
jgi:hypothetical protein